MLQGPLFCKTRFVRSSAHHTRRRTSSYPSSGPTFRTHRDFAAATRAPAMSRPESSPLLRGLRSHVVHLDGRLSDAEKVFGASKRTRASWMLAGVTAVVGTVAIAGVGADGMRSALGASAGVGMSDAMSWRPIGAGGVAAFSPSSWPRMGNDKWASYVQGPSAGDETSVEVARFGSDETLVSGDQRDPATMLQQWDQVVKWGTGLNPGDNSGDHPGLYDPVDPTIPFESDVDRGASSLTWEQAKQQGYVMTPETFKDAIKAHPTSFLVIHAVNGLGNRMRALAAAKCLARERNRKLIIVWERDDSLEAPVQSMMTPSFLRGSFILESLPYNFLAEEHEKLTKFNAGESTVPSVFSLIHDATTEWGKQRVSIETAPDAWSNWKGAAYIKSSHAELQLTASEYNFVGSYMVYFQPSEKVSAMMKTIPLSDKSDDQVVSMHIRAGEDSKLSKDLKLEGEAAAEVALVDSYRQQCTVSSFVDVLTRRAPDAVSRGISVFVAADTPEDVEALRARLPNNKVYALSRPDYCNYGYNRAREEECMIYAVADLFLLARNPGPMLRSKFSSFSDFANYYRKRAGRLQGKGFLVNGCSDDGKGQDGVLTAAASADLGSASEGHLVQKKTFSSKVKARFAMGVEGGGHYKLKLANLPTLAVQNNKDSPAPLGERGSVDAVSLCESLTTLAPTDAKHAARLCAARGLNQMDAFFKLMRNVLDDETALKPHADANLGTREAAPFAVDINSLLGKKPAAAAYPTPESSAWDPVFPEIREMAALAESAGVDFSVDALFRDPVEAVARTAGLSAPARSMDKASVSMFSTVLGSFAKQAKGYREMSTQLAGVSKDFYQCHSMDDETAVSTVARDKSSLAQKPARALLAIAEETSSDLEEASAAVGRWGWWGGNVVKKPQSSSDLGLGNARDALEPQIMAAYDALGADAFFMFSALSTELVVKSQTVDALSQTLQVAMNDRLSLLSNVQTDLGRQMNKVELSRYVDAENDAYVAYFAFRTGVCR